MVQRESGLLRYALEFFVSLNIALAVIWEKSSLSPFFLEVRLQYQINYHLGLHPHSNVGAFGAVFALALGLTLCIFLVLKISWRFSFSESILRQVAGITTLVALPSCWFYVHYTLNHMSIPMSPVVQPDSLSVPLLESALAVFCATLYLYEKWPIPPWLSLILLSLHWSYWGWRIFGPYFWARPPFLIFPIVGLCSSVTWGLYVSPRRKALLLRDRV